MVIRWLTLLVHLDSSHQSFESGRVQELCFREDRTGGLGKSIGDIR